MLRTQGKLSVLLVPLLLLSGCDNIDMALGGSGSTGIGINGWQLLGGQISPSTTAAEDPTMLVTGTTPSVGYRHDSFDIYLNSWNGQNWGTPKLHPQNGHINPSSYSTPGFASNGTSIFVAYSLMGGTEAGQEAFYDRIFIDQCTPSTAWTTWNNGLELSNPFTLVDGGADALEPAVAVTPGFLPVVAWVEEDVTSNTDTDPGAWLATLITATGSQRSGILSRDAPLTPRPTPVRTVAVTQDSAGIAYLAQWESDSADFNRTNLYVTQYNGINFTSVGDAISADFQPDNLSLPAMAFLGSDLYVAYSEADIFTRTHHIYVKKYNGTSWSLVGNGPVSAFNSSEHYNSGNPDLVVANGTLFLAWEESTQTGAGPFIFVAQWDSSNSQWVLDGDALNIDITRQARDPNLAFSSGDNTLYIAFEEVIDGLPQIFVRNKPLSP